MISNLPDDDCLRNSRNASQEAWNQSCLTHPPLVIELTLTHPQWMSLVNSRLLRNPDDHCLRNSRTASCDALESSSCLKTHPHHAHPRCNNSALLNCCRKAKIIILHCLFVCMISAVRLQSHTGERKRKYVTWCDDVAHNGNDSVPLFEKI